MNEPPRTGKAEPVEKKDQQAVGQGDKLDDAVLRVARATKTQPARDARDLKGDEVME